MLFTKQNYVESSHFKVANSVQASPGSCLILERLRFPLHQTANVNLYHVTKFPPYFSFTVYCFYTKISSFMLVLSTRIVLDLFYLLIFHSEKFSTDVCRLPYAVNVNLNLSISMSHSSLSSLCNELEHTRRIRG